MASDQKDELILLQKYHHKQAFYYISQALNIDENDAESKEIALQLYKSGVQHLKSGVSIDCSKNIGPMWSKARKLRGKMLVNLQLAEERINKLESKSAMFTHDNINSKNMSNKYCKGNKTDNRNLINKAKQTNSLKNSNHLPNFAKNISESQVNQNKSKSQKNFDVNLQNIIMNEIIEKSTTVSWNDIIGQEVAKNSLYEMVVLPLIKPELFTGLRSPFSGLLLYGPPGNGKTLLAKAVANETKTTFFSISAASLTSKYVGESEKLMRTLFKCASQMQPSIIFFDELDSIFTKRRDGEHEVSRRLKTQFLVEADGIMRKGNNQIFLLGATNRPKDLDEAVLRFPNKIYIAPPDKNDRYLILKNLLRDFPSCLTDEDLLKLASLTDNYSSNDLTNLAKDAALMPIREISPQLLLMMKSADIRKINIHDFICSLKKIPGSINIKDYPIYQL